VRLTIQYIARRLGIDDGEQELVFRLTNGLLRETAIGRRRIRPEELEVLGLRPPPPFQGRPS
jgi:hypothetical protein